MISASQGVSVRDSRHRMRIHVLLLPHVHVMDLAGPVQVFYEANGFGAAYELRYCGPKPSVRSAQGLDIANLEPVATVGGDDMVLVPGMDSSHLPEPDPKVSSWLREAHRAGARICSICSGAFVLARAGLLDGLKCTTHWKVAARMQRERPAAQVLENRLFVKDGTIITSAGVASGIDTALAIVEEDHGPLVAAKVAREMVVYIRREGISDQKSIYLDYRTHLHPGVHKVQDLMLRKIEERPTIAQLAREAGMSPRNLTRVFRQATGITLKKFSQELKLEIAGQLFRNPDYGMDAVASLCGFTDARQLRRLWRRRHGASPSVWRAQQERRSA